MRRAPVFQAPESAVQSRLVELEKENAALRSKLEQVPPTWSGLQQQPWRRRVVVDKRGLVDSIPLPKAIQRDLAWHTDGRNGAVDAAFNPSIFQMTNGSIWMLYRCECVPWFKYSRIAVVQLDPLLCPIKETNRLLDLPTDWDGYNAEDPRFVAQSGEWIFIAYNDGFRQQIAEVSAVDWKVRRFGKIDECGGMVLSEKEKNWTFQLVSDGQPAVFKVLYSIHPWVELEVVLGDSGARAVHKRTHNWKCDWPHGQVRGGTQFIDWWDGNRKLDALFFHSSVKIADCKHGPVRQYYAGMATTDGTRVVSMTPPILIGEPCPIENRPSQHQVVFPTGAMVRGDHVVVSYGLDDLDCALTCWTKAELSSLLVPVP